METYNILSEDFQIPQYAIELQDIIEDQLENKPSKGTAEYKLWKKKMNEIIDSHSKVVKFKAYKSIW